ncbi:GntR family transcriptional regulator [Castellaniella sp. GW247-6E4]|uniref:GntR family transcriptional regulator n=1 Tax=Castellaniella sp. GW247-6E4 TaxID=3140380 RepID=UPI00331471D8
MTIKSNIKVRRQKLTAQSYVLDSLRSSITDGSLAPGTRLILTEVANQLGVSVTPVREAIQNLSAEGLIVITPSRGAFIRGINLKDVREIYELRGVLEPIMVRRIIERITQKELNQASLLNKKMSNPGIDLDEWVEMNRQFHAIFSEERDESELASILTRLRANAVGYVRFSLRANPKHIKESNTEHTNIIEAFEEKNTEKAVSITLRHLQETIYSIENFFEEFETQTSNPQA